MQSTLVATKTPNPKTTLYVGGLDEGATPASLHAAFVPFGELKDVSLPTDPATGRHRGFGFVEYEDPGDAAAAIDNMNDAELNGRVLRVNLAQARDSGGGLTGVWGEEGG
jgi:peptidyl-prolyl isomerase E (cyclophilin E)